MIPVEAAKAAISQAQLFDRRSDIITAVGQTPVAAVMNFITMRTTNPGSPEDWTPDAEVISYLSAGCAEDTNTVSLCTQQLDVLARDIGAEVSQHLFFTRNTVQPVIKLVAASIKEHVDRLPPDVDRTVTIIEKELPTPAYELEDDILKFNDAPYMALTDRMIIGTKTHPEITEMMLTGKKGVDAVITTWMVTQPASVTEGIWKALFSAEPTDKSADAWLRDPLHAQSAAMVAYLCASKMIEQIPDGLNVSRGSFRDFMSKVLAQAAKVLCAGFDDESQAMKSKRLINASVFKTVYVNKRVYQQWLSEGGQIQAIHGNSLLAMPFYFVDQINENQASLISKWRDYCQQAAVGEAERRHALIRDIIKDAFDDVVVQNFAMCFGHLSDNPTPEKNQNDYLAYRSKLVTMLAAMHNDDYEKDPWGFVINLVLCCLYEKAPCAKAILDGIASAKRANPDATPEECASLSAMTYVADYIADQLVV